MADKEYILTVEGKAELEQELDKLKNVTRKEVSEKIKEARSFGDLSENAEYDAAKDEQAEVEARIQQIEHMLKYAKVVEDEGLDTVTVGKKVTIEYIEPAMGTTTYSIVGTTEADPYKNRLSYESPVGAALMNHNVGDEVSAVVPAGTVKLRILEITR